MHISQIISAVTTTVTVASVICNVLPKSTVFADYPRVKKAYETAINVVIALAFNVRTYMPSLNIHIPGLGFTPPTAPGFVAPPDQGQK